MTIQRQYPKANAAATKAEKLQAIMTKPADKLKPAERRLLAAALTAYANKLLKK